MGCCVLGALIISRWIYAFQRVRAFAQRFGNLVNLVGIRHQSWNRTLAMFDGGRSMLTALMIAEGTVLFAIAVYEAPRALEHGPHILSALQAMQSATMLAEIPPVICAAAR